MADRRCGSHGLAPLVSYTPRLGCAPGQPPGLGFRYDQRSVTAPPWLRAGLCLWAGWHLLPLLMGLCLVAFAFFV